MIRLYCFQANGLTLTATGLYSCFALVSLLVVYGKMLLSQEWEGTSDGEMAQVKLSGRFKNVPPGAHRELKIA